MKRTISLLLTILLLVGMVPAGVSAADIASGTGWNLSSDGVLHITGAVPSSGFGLTDDQKLLVKSAVAEPGASISDGHSLFSYFKNMTGADLKNLKTVGVTNMGEMFYECKKLTSLDISGFDTGSVTHMHEMFCGCSALASLDLSSLDTSKVIDMTYMFAECSGLTSLDLSCFDTGSVEEMYCMFSECSGLTSLDISGFDTGSVEQFALAVGMFDGCSSLVSLGIGPELLSANADNIIAIRSPWIRRGSAETYSTAGELMAVTDTVTLLDKYIIADIDFTFDVPNDGEGLVYYYDGLGRVTCNTAGVKATAVHALLYNKIVTGIAKKGDRYGFAITFEPTGDYQMADDCTVKINGTECEMTAEADGSYKAVYGATITYNPDIQITLDLPETIEYSLGNYIIADVDASGEDLEFYWQLGTKVEGSATKQRVADTFSNIKGYESRMLRFPNADESYDGKLLRCVIKNNNGNVVTRAAVLKAGPHIHGSITKYDDKEHWGECKCGFVHEKDREPHDIVYDFDEIIHFGECECGYKVERTEHDLVLKSDAERHWYGCICGYDSADAAHEFGEWKVIKEATEKEAGSRERVCSFCGYKETEVLPVKGHTHSYALKNDETGHWNECSGCKDIKDKAAHSFGEWIVTKEAEGDTAGSKERVCEVCEYKEIAPVPAKAPGIPFTDVDKKAYYHDAVVWAYNAEPQITDGNGKDKFMPLQLCTRGQVVTFLWRAQGCPAPKSTKNPFADVTKDDYFYEPVLWAVENGITDGTDATHFSPNSSCRNSHILTFIYRAMGEPGKTEAPASWYTDAYNWANSGGLLEDTYEGTYDVNSQCPRMNVVQYLYRYYTIK